MRLAALVLVAALGSRAVAQSLPARASIRFWVRNDPDRHAAWVQEIHGDTLVLMPQRSHGAWHILLESDTLLLSGIDSLDLRLGGNWSRLYFPATRDSARPFAITIRSSPLWQPGALLRISSADLGWTDRRAVVAAARGDSLEVDALDSTGHADRTEHRVISPDALDRLAVRLTPHRSRFDHLRHGFMVGGRVAFMMYVSLGAVVCSGGGDCRDFATAGVPIFFVPLGAIGAAIGAAASPSDEVWIDVSTHQAESPIGRQDH